MAASLNRIVLCGNLTADPELSYTPSGMAITKFSMAVNERVKNQQEEWVDRPCYVDITAFGRQAETSNEYLSKGAPVLLEGKLRYDTWDAKDGSGKRSKHYVVADRVQFLSSRSESVDSKPAAAPKPKMEAPQAPMSDNGADNGAEAGDDGDIPPF